MLACAWLHSTGILPYFNMCLIFNIILPKISLNWLSLAEGEERIISEFGFKINVDISVKLRMAQLLLSVLMC